jgi:two-component system sensor histidine kinase KdpD
LDGTVGTAGQGDSPNPIDTMKESGASRLGDWDRSEAIRIVLAIVSVMVLTLAMLLFRDALGVLNVMLLYLILSFMLGLLLGVRASATGAVLAFFAYDVLFIPPYYTLTVADSDHVLGLFVYIGVAIGTAMLMARLRTQTDTAIRENRRTTLLYDLNRSLVGEVTLDSLLRTIADRVVEIYGSTGCRILIGDGNGGLDVRAAFPPTMHASLDRQARAMAQYAIDHRVPAGMGGSSRRIRQPHGTVTFARPIAVRSQDALYIPITAASEALGVLEVTGRPGGGRFTNEDERLLTSFADQVALAIERTRLTEEATRAAVLEESDQLKSAMLAAVSHDLRTPLAAIKASASTLLDPSVEWPREARDDLLTAIEEETDRLTLMVSNLLDLSRIEGGALRPDRDWHDLHELVFDVVRQARGRAGSRTIEVELPDDLPVVFIDYVEIAQVLVNLVGNAINYSPDGSAIAIRAAVAGDAVELSVEDQGIGIPAAELPHIFTTFYRADTHGPVAGSGIGLAICKGLVEAHGGKLWAESVEGKGTIMRFTLPLGEFSR